MHHAVLRGDLEVLHLVIEASGGVFTGSGEDSSPLHLAVQAGDVQATEYLIQAGAAPSRWAIEHEPSTIARGMCCSREDILLYALRDDAPLDVTLALLPTSMSRHGLLELDDPMIDLAAAVDDEGASCLHCECAGPPSHAHPIPSHTPYPPHAACPTLLTPPCVHVPRAPLPHHSHADAARRDDDSLVRLMLHVGVAADLAHRTTAHTPLFDAITAGSVESAEALLEGGALVDATDCYGRTPLMHA